MPTTENYLSHVGPSIEFNVFQFESNGRTEYFAEVKLGIGVSSLGRYATRRDAEYRCSQICEYIETQVYHLVNLIKEC